jgi:hypothetical protein
MPPAYNRVAACHWLAFEKDASSKLRSISASVHQRSFLAANPQADLEILQSIGLFPLPSARFSPAANPPIQVSNELRS